MKQKESVLAKSYFSNELASKMEVDKYVNHMSFYRQLEQMKRDGWDVAKTENVLLSNFGLASFQIIYGVEELIIELGLTGADKIAYRKENAAMAWQSLLAWCVFTVNNVPQNSQMHKACNYVIRHYDELTAYMDYDVVPLDNNATESAIRALVMGKQNYLFCQNEESCHYAAVMYTFFAACKVLKINPEKWLSDVLDKIPFTSKEKLSELLP